MSKTGAALEDQINSDKFSKLGNKMTFGIFLFVIIFNWADQNIFSPKLDALITDFGFDPSQTTPLSIVASLFMVTSGIGMVIFGILADRHKRKWISVTAAFFYGCCTLITSFSPSGIEGYWFLFIVRLLSGFGLGAIVPAIFSMIGDTAENDKRATIFSLFTVATVIGQLGGLALASISEDWRTGYFYIGIIEIVLAFGMLFTREPKRGASERELETVLVEGAEYQFRIKREDIKLLWSNKSNKWIILNFVDTIPSSMLIFVIFKYLLDTHGIIEANVTLTLGFGILGGIIGALVFGYIGDKWYRKNKRARVILAIICNNVPVFIYMMIFLPVFDGFFVTGDPEFAELLSYPEIKILIGIIFFTMLINQGVGPNWYSSVLDVNLPEHRATMISIASFADLLGKAIGPLIGGIIYEFISGRAAMLAVAIFWISNSVLWIPVYKNIKKDIQRVGSILSDRAEMLRRGDTKE